MDSYNFTSLCGFPTLNVWNPTSHTLGQCFQKLFLITPVYALLAVVSAYYVGKQSPYVLRSRSENTILYARLAIVCAMVLLTVLVEPLILVFEAKATLYWVDVVSFGVQGLAWTVHLGYLATLRVRRVGSSIRGSRVVLAVWVLCALTAAIMTHSCFSNACKSWLPKQQIAFKALAVTQLTLQMLYCLSVFPQGEGRGEGGGHYRELQQDRLLQQQAIGEAGPAGQYTRFHEVADPFYLGTAEGNATRLSYLSLHWVNSLLEKGSVGLLRTVDDLPMLPQDLRTQQVSYTVRRHLLLSQPLPLDEREDAFPSSSSLHHHHRSQATSSKLLSSPPSNSSSSPSPSNQDSPDLDSTSAEVPNVTIRNSSSRHGDSFAVKKQRFSLFWALHSMYGALFYGIGLLKLVSDACGFAGPLLLHELVVFVDQKEEQLWKGYVYTLALCSASLIASVSSVHFNYSMARWNVKVRTALVTSIFRKVQSLTIAQSSSFTSGEVLNLMSTDIERVLNFGQSFHSFWSLPLQLGITLYLLYVQIGLAFLAGVAIVVLLIPINRLLAVKIGSLSRTMMQYKDARVTLMTELLSMIRSVKMNGWEDLFTDRIDKERKGELEALAGRKYLDAACVYFWAATPVLIPIAVFTTYITLGNEMDAARVFTAVALLNMLVMPLNAFPWVINGLVEAYVSFQRMERLLQIDEEDLSQFYTIVADMSSPSSDLQLIIHNGMFSWDANTSASPKHHESLPSAAVNAEDDDEGDGFSGGGGGSNSVGVSGVRSTVSSLKRSVIGGGRAGGQSRKKFFGGDRDTDEEDLVQDEDKEQGEESVHVGDGGSSPHFGGDDDDDGDGLNIIPRGGVRRGRQVSRTVSSRSLGDVNSSRQRQQSSGSVLGEENCTRSHSVSSSTMDLRDINLQVSRGEVVAIIGRTGSGKSSLINAILAEMTKTKGVVAVAALHHGFGYAAQDPWIQDLTIKENILFGAPFDQDRYDQVVYACALTEDFRSLPKGEHSRCGVGGQCLSGGQKSRVALARAIYQQKGMYILDGILSSVDGPVARHIMKEVVLGFLKGRTVLFTTHHVHLTNRCSTVIRMHHGRITHVGPPDEVLPHFLSAQELLRDWWQDSSILGGGGINNNNNNNDWASTGAVPRHSASSSRAVPGTSAVEPDLNVVGTPPHRGGDGEALLLLEEHQKCALLSEEAEEDLNPPSLAHLSPTDREHPELGALSWRVYHRYLSSVGYGLAVATLLALAGMQFSRNLTDFWLSYWVTIAHGANNNTMPGWKDNITAGGMVNHHPHHNLGGYPEDSTVVGGDMVNIPSSSSVYSGGMNDLTSGGGEGRLDASRLVVAFGSWLVHPAIHRHTHAHPFSWVASMGAFVQPPPGLLDSTYSGNGYLDPSDSQAPVSPTNRYCLVVYCIIAAAHSVFTLLRAFGFAYCGLKAAKILHKKLLASVLCSSMGFFEHNPVGRVLNRFSSDLYTVDDSLPFQLNIFCAMLFGLIGSIIVTVYGLPWMILIYVPAAMCYYNMQHYYRYTSRDLRRLYAVSLSPLYAHFTQTLSGLSTIRAMRGVNSASSECEQLLENSQRAWLSLQATSQWLNLRLQLLGVLVLGGVAALALVQHHTAVITPGIVGLIISYALTINGFLNGVVTSFTETERELVSVERVDQYINHGEVDGQGNGAGGVARGLGSYGGVGGTGSVFGVEEQTRGAGASLNPGPNWPQHNTIRFEGVYLKYNFHNPYALRDVSFRVGANEKIGILGRTGAGKSSIFSALFRLVEPTRGTIFIDNVDICGLSVSRLRCAMAIIPQSPPLFSGTVRQNLDPRSQHSDARIWSALRACYADTAVLAAVARIRRQRAAAAAAVEQDLTDGAATGGDMEDNKSCSKRRRKNQSPTASKLDQKRMRKTSSSSRRRSDGDAIITVEEDRSSPPDVSDMRGDSSGSLRGHAARQSDGLLECLDFEMTDVGRTLAQGERQLLVLARALLTKAKIVCMDEGTAQLDPITEDLVQRTLRDAFHNTTMLIIAHRLRTLDCCDRLVVLEGGEVVEEGSPHELRVRTDSRYSHLLRRQ